MKKVKNLKVKRALTIISAVLLLSLTTTITIMANETSSSTQEQVTSEMGNQNTVEIETKDEIEAKLKVAEKNGEVSIASEKDLETLIKLEEEVQEDLSNFVDDKPLEADKPSKSVRARYGSWSWRDGVIALTDGGSGYQFLYWDWSSWHAAIVAPQWLYAVVEAGPGNGVFVTHSSASTNNFERRYPNNQVWQVAPRTTSVAQDLEAGRWAGRQVGKPYNNDFAGDIRRTDKFYCSQLVWAAYYYSCGYDLDLPRYNTPGTWRIHPKEIYDADTALIYRKS
ncbi:hypothetical protein FACS1894193_13430 [Bacilli bacterium]|nr:hypothetical protein FACS1894193_13430 [Bacilli bacterium]